MRRSSPGLLDYDRIHDAITGFELSALGTHRGEEVSSIDDGSSLFGIDLRLAVQVPPGVIPHGLRDPGYYLLSHR